MSNQESIEEIRGYCSQCSCWCRTISYVKDGRFVAVKPDEEHPLATPICPKASAGPELVYNKQRLQYPMRRTRPKGDPDPGWERISWDEALDTIAAKLNEVKEKFGPEAVATSRTGPAGSAMGEVWPWLKRFPHIFGTPNNISTTYICQWHRDICSGYTYGNPRMQGFAGRPDFERAGCILIWGCNIKVSRTSLLPLIEKGIKNGAKLIVIDPRAIELTDKADVWLQVKPGTDCALALSMLNVMIEENLYDYDFTRDWTTAPFLVRSDTGDLLRASDLIKGADAADCVVVDSVSNKPEVYTSGVMLPVVPVLDTAISIKLVDGKEVECKSVFRLLSESVSKYSPGWAEKLTGVPESKIRDAVRTFATSKPACWYAWNGIEQNIDASQTNRAICILYALTGDYDKPGGNVILPRVPLNSILGLEFVSPEAKAKCLGYDERPLGTSTTWLETQGYEVYKAILTGKPYPIKALFCFGGNLITSSAPTSIAREALIKLDFHAHCEMFLSPTAELADIVLPIASSWETWHVGSTIDAAAEKAYFQLRPAVVPPQHESWPEIKVMLELAKKLGLGDKFWEGDMEAGFNHWLAPTGITVEQLRNNPGGIPVDVSMEYRKYSKEDDAGKFRGLLTPSKRVEIYSQIFKDHGYDPLPEWKEPLVISIARTGLAEKYPLILTGGKVVQYSHSQHRALPSLRKVVPHPFVEINPQKAAELGCNDGDWVLLETPHGSITVQAKLTKGIIYDVVCIQNGWWQGCPELDLPGYDPYSSEGANMSLLYSSEEKDPISGCLPIKGYPCNIKKK